MGQPTTIKARDLTPGQVFEYGGATYTMLHFKDLAHEKSFILESHQSGNVFESLISPDLEVTPVTTLDGR